MFNNKSKQQATSTQVANAAKTLLANIRFLDVDHPVKTIVITSSVPNEGKSFVTEQLAEAIATSGQSVLLIEGDLRRRTLASRMNLHAKYGMYSVVSGNVALQQAVVSTRTKGFYFLDVERGIPNPSDLFASEKFEDFLDIASASFDYVLIDTPPIQAFIDAAVLSTKVDATFMVVREGFAKRDQIEDSYKQLLNAGGRIEGVIMNDCKHKSAGYGYYYYYGDEKKQGAPAPAFVADPSKQTLTPKKATASRPSRMANPVAKPQPVAQPVAQQVTQPAAQTQRAAVNPLVNSKSGQKLQDHSRFSR